MDTVLTGALVVLVAVMAVTGGALLAFRFMTRPQGDEAATEIGVGPSTSAGAWTDLPDSQVADTQMPMVVPMHREAGRERDVERFLRDAEQTQAALDKSLTPQQAKLIEAARRAKARLRDD